MFRLTGDFSSFAGDEQLSNGALPDVTIPTNLRKFLNLAAGSERDFAHSPLRCKPQCEKADKTLADGPLPNGGTSASSVDGGLDTLFESLSQLRRDREVEVAQLEVRRQRLLDQLAELQEIESRELGEYEERKKAAIRTWKERRRQATSSIFLSTSPANAELESTCQICCFRDVSKKLEPCGHSMCTPCAAKIFGNYSFPDSSLYCPYDRRVIDKLSDI